MASDSHNPPDARDVVWELEAENARLRALNPGAEWLEPWCDEHHEDSPGQRCIACVGASHDAWMHRAKAAEAEVERLREALEIIAQHARLDESERGCREAARYYGIAREALEAGER